MPSNISCNFSRFWKMRCRRFLLFIPSDASVVFWQDAATENRWILHGAYTSIPNRCAALRCCVVSGTVAGIRNQFVLFFLLFAYSRKPRREGQILAFTCFLRRGTFFFLEYLRYDEIRGIFWDTVDFTMDQLILLPVWTVFTVEKKKIGLIPTKVSKALRSLKYGVLCISFSFCRRVCCNNSESSCKVRHGQWLPEASLRVPSLPS